MSEKNDFLSKLQELGGSAGNKTLRASLGWSENDYESVKNTLKVEGQITMGKGRGGSVALAGYSSNVSKVKKEKPQEPSDDSPEHQENGDYDDHPRGERVNVNRYLNWEQAQDYAARYSAYGRTAYIHCVYFVSVLPEDGNGKVTSKYQDGNEMCRYPTLHEQKDGE